MCIRDRLYALAQLKRKLHRSLDEILELREEIRENISFLDACALDITLLDKEEKQLAVQLQEVLSALLPQRREAAEMCIRDRIPDKLRQFAFRDIDDLPEMQAYGWVCFEDMLDSEWRTAPPHKGAYLLFSLRLDTDVYKRQRQDRPADGHGRGNGRRHRP